MIWTILTCLLVALTKYLTSVRLRNLRDKIQKDQKDASDLKRLLFEASEKEELWDSERNQLIAKVASLHAVLGNLERSLNKGTTTVTANE